MHGEVVIGGAKNAALGIIAGAILTDEPVTIENLPDVSDINVLLDAIEGIVSIRSPLLGMYSSGKRSSRSLSNEHSCTKSSPEKTEDDASCPSWATGFFSNKSVNSSVFSSCTASSRIFW